MIKKKQILTVSYIVLFLLLQYVMIFVLQVTIPILILVDLFILAIICFLSRYEILATVGNLLFSIGDKNRSYKFLKKATDRNIKNSTAYLNFGIYLVRDGDFTKSLECMEKAMNNKPDVITQKNIELTMASCYWVAGRIDDAIQLLEKLKSKHEYVNNHVLTTLGYLYLTKNDYEKALSYTQQAVTDSPESGAAWDNYGQIYYKQNDMEKSEEAFLKALSFNENLVDSLYYMGEISEKKGDIKRAYEYYSKASESRISALNTVTVEQINDKLQSTLIKQEIKK